MGDDISMAKAIKDRLRKAEARQQAKPPRDLCGRYYDELSKAEKERYWRYIYGDSYTVKQAEEIELRFIGGTLHFVCDLMPGDYDLPEIDAWEARIRRMI